MNYLLGREVEKTVRVHLHSCRKCRQRMEALEQAAEKEAIEQLEADQSFALQRPATAPARRKARQTPRQKARRNSA